MPLDQSPEFYVAGGLRESNPRPPAFSNILDRKRFEQFRRTLIRSLACLFACTTSHLYSDFQIQRAITTVPGYVSVHLFFGQIINELL